MKKHIFAALLALTLAPASLVKADSNYSLLVNTADGNSIEYQFEYLPVATFEGNEMIITDDRNVKGVRYAIENVVNMTIKSGTSGVEGVADANHVKIAVANDILSVSGLEAEVQVMVYDAAGKLVASALADQNGAISLSIGNLGKGVYVVALPNQSFKFIR